MPTDRLLRCPAGPELVLLGQRQRRDRLQRGELLEYRPRGRAEQVAEGFEPSILAGLQIEDGQSIGFLARQGMDDMEAVAREQPHRQIARVELVGRRQIAAHPQAIGDDKGITYISMVAIDVGLGEVGGQARVERIELERPRLQSWVALQCLEEVPPVPAGGFGGDLDGVEVALGHLLGELLHQQLSAGTIVVDGAARTEQPAGLIHQTDGVGLAMDIHADQ